MLRPADAAGQGDPGVTEGCIERLQRQAEDFEHRLDVLEKMIDDLLWFERIGDAAFIDKVFLTGPPPRIEENPTGPGAGNPLKFWAYVFIPRGVDPAGKYPLIVFPHGGVHGSFTTYYTHIVRELIAQGYIVVAPEYRGSTGYGRGFYERIDYGGLETEDAWAARQYVIDNYPVADGSRTGIIGWSHGGLIALHNVFEHPEGYRAAFAGVPVSDLVARMGYMTQEYRDLFSADHHIGKTAQEDVAEYRRRSPAWNAHRLETPLLIHGNTNDEDVNVLEVEHLVKSLKAEGKKFEYEIFEDLPGGHSFDRLDTKRAKEIRLKIWTFLAGYLDPPVRLRSVADIDRAAYGGLR
jgi:dipeptidyl aminopeptidase/acylaminoacyl peptidase